MIVVMNQKEADYECKVCGEVTDKYNGYGVLVCSSCRVFFRRYSQRTLQESCYNAFNRNMKRPCEIKESTRTFCPPCRYAKCLAMGMSSRKVKRVRGIPTVKEAIAEAVKILNVPNGCAAKPFLKLTQLINVHSALSFTIEENLLLGRIQEAQIKSWTSIPFPVNALEKTLQDNKASRATVIPAVEAGVERLVKFALELDHFQLLEDKDQFALLALNTNCLMIPMCAYYFKATKEQQASMSFYGCPYQPVNLDFWKLPKMGMSQILPWVNENHPLFNIIYRIQDLELDHPSILLFYCILIFNGSNHSLENESRIREVQDYYRLTLFRYLASKMSRASALWKMDLLQNIIHDMIALPQIRIDS